MNGRELAATIGVTPRVLSGWTTAGYLHPEYVIDDGHTVCRYGSGDVLTATRMARLARVGLPPRVAYRLVSGDPALTAVLLAEIDGASAEPVLEPMVRDEPAAERAVVDAMDLAVAVRDVDPRDLWRELDALRVCDPRRLLAAAVGLAAMVPVDRPVRELLAWTESFDVQEVA